jgi:hypothetical protein
MEDSTLQAQNHDLSNASAYKLSDTCNKQVTAFMLPFASWDPQHLHITWLIPRPIMALDYSLRRI